MTNADLIDWATRAGGLSGLLALVWTRWDRWADRRRTRRERLTLDVELPDRLGALLRVRYAPEDFAQALVARLEVLRPEGVVLSHDLNGRWQHGPGGESRANPNLSGDRAVEVKLQRRHDGAPVCEGLALAVGSLSNGGIVKVTVSTWPTAKRLTQQQRQISAHV